MKSNSLALFLALLIAGGPAFLHAETPAEKTPLRLADLAIPESLGKIDERFQGRSSRWVVDIQDVHAHFGAQENIAAILDHLNELYGLRRVAVEGGWSSTSYPKTWALPSSREKQIVLRTLLEEDRITGPAFAAMTAKMPISLQGVEDEDLYKKNMRVYLSFLRQKDTFEKKITAFQDQFTREKTTAMNPELLRFDRESEKFNETPKTIDKFFPFLTAQAAALKLDLADLAQLDLFQEMTALEKSIDKEKLKSEAQRLMQENKQNRLSFEELLRHGKFPEDKLAFYPNAKKQMELIRLQDGLAHDQLFSEIEKAVERVKQALFKNEAEKALDARFNRFLTAKKVMLMKATPDDFKKYRESESIVRAELDDSVLQKALALGKRFYKLAQKRDEVFFEKMTSDPALSQEDIALVAGGFHTDGLRKKLRAAGISYLVITPNLGEVSPDEDLYVKRLEEARPAVKAQTLSERNNSENDFQDARIAEGILANQSGKMRDVRQVVDFVAAGGLAVEMKPAGLDWTQLPEAEQYQALDRAVQSVLEGKSKVWLVVKADALSRILESSPEAAAMLKIIMKNTANQLAILARNYLDLPELVSDAFGQPNVKNIPEPDLDRALARQRVLQDALRLNKVAVIAGNYKNPRVRVILPEDALSLLLFRPLVEQGWIFSWDDPKTRTAMIRLLGKVLAARGLMEASA